MAKFISVLDPDSPAPFWTAVQWAETLTALKANHFYTAGVNLTIPKNGAEENQGTVTITEVNTKQPVTATVIMLSPVNVNFVQLASTKASKRYLKTLLKIGGNDGR